MDQYTGEVKASKNVRYNLSLFHLHAEQTKPMTSNIVCLLENSIHPNRDTTRQPGSTFKIVSTYAAALDTAGFTLASVQYDEENYHSPDGTPFK